MEKGTIKGFYFFIVSSRNNTFLKIDYVEENRRIIEGNRREAEGNRTIKNFLEQMRTFYC